MYLSSYDIDAYIDSLSRSEMLQLAARLGLIDSSVNLASLGDLDGFFSRLAKKLKKTVKRVVKVVKKVVKKVAPIAAIGAAVYFGGPAATSAIMNLAMQKRAAKAAEQQVAAESLALQPFVTEAQAQQALLPRTPVPTAPVAAPIYIAAPGPAMAPAPEPTQAAAAPMPQWLIPTAIGAVGLVLALTMANVKRS